LYDDPGLFDLLRRVELLILVVDLQANPIEQMNDTLEMLEKHRIRPRQLAGEVLPQDRIISLPALLLANKCDDESLDEVFEIFNELLDPMWHPLPVSAFTGRNFDSLKARIYELLEIIRVYAKPPGKGADLEKPFVLKKGSTVVDMAVKVHRDFTEHLKSARVWGSSAFDGQLVQREYILCDGDIVELRV
jgi:ribosome-interacting GTPase 1